MPAVSGKLPAGQISVAHLRTGRRPWLSLAKSEARESANLKLLPRSCRKPGLPDPDLAAQTTGESLARRAAAHRVSAIS